MTTPGYPPGRPPLLDIPRDRATVVRRLPRPVLLVAVLLLLFMPFLTVSCSSPVGGSMGVDFSGWDSTLGTEPSARGLEGLGDDTAENSSPETREMRFSSMVGIAFGVGFFGVLLGGATLLLMLGSSRARSLVAAGTAALAVVMLTVNHLALRSFVNESLAESARQGGEVDVTPFIDVETRAGLIVTLTYLVLFAVANAAGPAYSTYLARMGAAPQGYGGMPPVNNPQPAPNTTPTGPLPATDADGHRP